MSLSANGTFSGLPLQSGLFSFVVRLESNGLEDEVEVVMEVVGSSPDNVEVTTFAGSGGNGTFVEGNGTAAGFKSPMALAFDASGNLYVADTGNHRIRKITPQGNVTTFAGSGNATFANGNATSASFSAPSGLAFDASGNLYVADAGNHRIRKISPAGNVTTFAGSGNATFANGNATSASFHSPKGLAFDASGNLYVADSGNHRIRKISPVGTVTTFAGSGNATFANGNATSAGFNQPLGLSTDSSGNVYVADFHNHRIRKITPSGIVSTLAGGNLGVFADGIGENARFYNPTGVVATSNGTIYVTDFGFNKVRKITPGALVTTYAGS
jgi:streptogramin lyase